MAGAGRCRLIALGSISIAAVPGHFPDDPIIPGVLLLADIFALLTAAYPGQRVDRLLQARFLRPVRPDAVLALTGRTRPGGLVDFEGAVGGLVALRGAVRMAPA